MTPSAVPTDIRRDLVAILPQLRRFGIILTGSCSRADALVEKVCAGAVMSSHRWTAEDRLEFWVFGLMQIGWADEAQTGMTDIPNAHGTSRESAAGRLLDCLPTELAAPLLLVDAEGFSYAETASILNIAADEVSARLCAARLHLAHSQQQRTERRA